jgi:hypothetical protein
MQKNIDLRNMGKITMVTNSNYVNQNGVDSDKRDALKMHYDDVISQVIKCPGSSN